MGFYEAKRNAIFFFFCKWPSHLTLTGHAAYYLVRERTWGFMRRSVTLCRQTFVAFFRRPTRLNSLVRLARCRRPRRAPGGKPCRHGIGCFFPATCSPSPDQSYITRK